MSGRHRSLAEIERSKSKGDQRTKFPGLATATFVASRLNASCSEITDIITCVTIKSEDGCEEGRGSSQPCPLDLTLTSQRGITARGPCGSSPDPGSGRLVCQDLSPRPGRRAAFDVALKASISKFPLKSLGLIFAVDSFMNFI